ncbi:hypothetical protein [Alkalihalobacillus hemicellulosilyticus]|uniref:hypothetical protein n=1 Tax=Halalkalibacter hemicellulosilyticus TaxID=127886 RepID=UPI001F4111B8|nr:hypothetical protein [Halalkalibacter hemicellulosilyticus]
MKVKSFNKVLLFGLFALLIALLVACGGEETSTDDEEGTADDTNNSNNEGEVVELSFWASATQIVMISFIRWIESSNLMRSMIIFI